jgi:hypothetical protein
MEIFLKIWQIKNVKDKKIISVLPFCVALYNLILGFLISPQSHPGMRWDRGRDLGLAAGL